MEVDGGLEVFAVAVAAGGDAEGLDAGVEAFGAGGADAAGEVGQQAGLGEVGGLRGNYTPLSGGRREVLR